MKVGSIVRLTKLNPTFGSISTALYKLSGELVVVELMFNNGAGSAGYAIRIVSQDGVRATVFTSEVELVEE